MTTAFLQLHDALLAALTAAPAVAGGRIHAGRARPMPAEHASDVTITAPVARGRQVITGNGPVDWEMPLGIEIRARGSDSINAMEALDPLLSSVWARVSTATVPPGVMAWQMRPEMSIDVEEADTPIAVLRLAVSAQFRTAAGSLALAP